MNIYSRAAIDAAKAAGALIKRSVGKVVEVSYKGRDNIVTNVDKAAEEAIIRRLLARFPDHGILSEERAPVPGRSSCKWIVDPLDGTSNFAHAFPFFCVSIALERDGKIILGVVYDPMRDELYHAEAGKGSFLNRRRIHVSGTTKLADGFLATGFAYGKKRKDRNVKYFKRLLVESLAIRRAGSAALDLCYVACGRFDGFWEMDLHPWDSAAGTLIVREAKGRVTRFDGSEFTPYDKDILATNRFIHSSLSRILSR